jgi:hypothetical protein
MLEYRNAACTLCGQAHQPAILDESAHRRFGALIDVSVVLELGLWCSSARDLLEQLDVHDEAVVVRGDQATGPEPLQRPADGALVQPSGVDQLRWGACAEHERRHDAQPLGLGK